MANLPETATYDAGVYQLETTDPVQGGVSGVSNSPLKNLANRTAYLKQRVDSIEAGTTDLPGYAKLASPAFTGSPTAPTQQLGDNSTKIANTAFVQGTVGGRLAKSVAGGANVTLTAVEAGNAILDLSGALTANIAVIVPTSPTRPWIVKNATSGAYTLTIKTAAGTGVIVTQGTTAVVWTDGTNVYDALTDFDSPALTGTPTAPTAAAATNTTQLATTAFATYATDGRAAVNVAGSADVTLTATQYGAAILDLSGTLTADIDLIFPNLSGQWVVANNSDGDFNITCKTAAGTGVTLPVDAAVVLYGDGTNIYFAGSASQVSFKRQSYAPSAGATSLSVTGGYTPGNVMVEKNGSMLDASAFTATNGSSVELTSASITDDTFTVYAFKSFEVANAVQKSGDTMGGPLILSGNAADPLEAVPLQQLEASTRIRLTGNLTLYVSTSGSDSNDGLSAGAPFLTIQKAWNAVKNDYDLNGFSVTVQLADGTYTAGLNAVGRLVGAASESALTFKGNSATPANVFVSTTSSNAFAASGGAQFVVRDMKLKTTTSGNCLNCVGQGTTINFNNLVFDAVSTISNHINVQLGGRVSTSAAYSIIGGGYSHFSVSSSSMLDVNATVTVTGTPAFASAFVIATILCSVNATGSTFSGAATGTRYSSTLNAVINTNGGGANFFPGNAPGSAPTGLYV